MSTSIEIHGFKIHGNDVSHGLKYLEGLREVELREMLNDAKRDYNQDFHFKAYIPGKGEKHYVLIHQNDGTYELRPK